MLEATDRFLITKDWITLIFVLILVLFALIKYSDGNRLSRLLTLIQSKNYLVIYQKQTPLVLNTFHILFAVIQLFVFSLIVFIGVKSYNTVARELELRFFLSILTGAFFLLVFRFFVGKALASLFELEKEFDYLTYVKISYLSNFTLLILPIVLFAIYAQYNSINFSFFVLILSAIILLIYYVLMLRTNEKLIFSKLFYFILYLCALEIAPLVLLYKLFIV